MSPVPSEAATEALHLAFRAISMFERQTLLALLPAASLLIVLIWVLESRAGMIEPPDGVAYPALIVTWAALFAMLWRWLQRLLLVRWLATVPLLGFFAAGTMMRWIEWVPNPASTGSPACCRG